MNLRTLSAALLAAFSLNSFATDVILETNYGDIEVELYDDKAPISVKNFLRYTEEGIYNGTIFHRVMKRFVIQAGGFDKDLVHLKSYNPIVNEAKTNRLHNKRGTLAMARTDHPDSATSQFFINLRMNANLDYGRGKAGYAVFGKVKDDSMHIVYKIAKADTESAGRGFENLPTEPVTIIRVNIKKAPANKTEQAEAVKTENDSQSKAQ